MEDLLLEKIWENSNENQEKKTFSNQVFFIFGIIHPYLELK